MEKRVSEKYWCPFLGVVAGMDNGRNVGLLAKVALSLLEFLMVLSLWCR